ncbi:MAG: RNA polymerase sigma factor [Verrucomicrobiales bacterium]
MTPGDPRGGGFADTRWTLVLRSQGGSPEAQSALSDLCAAYYEPVRVFIQRSGYEAESARDLTHQFFARVLERQNLSANPDRGRFRSYLFGAVKHFLFDQSDQERALKRGGGAVMVPLDASTDTSPGIELPDPSALTPDRAFDRRWALTVLDRALGRVGSELAEAGKSAFFETLKPWLIGDSNGVSQAEIGKVFGISEGAVKVAIHRLRQKFREAVKAEIAQTVETSAEIKEELNYLLSVV